LGGPIPFPAMSTQFVKGGAPPAGTYCVVSRVPRRVKVPDVGRRQAPRGASSCVAPGTDQIGLACSARTADNSIGLRVRTFTEGGSYGTDLSVAGAACVTGQRAAGAARMATDHGSAAKRGCRELQSSAARVRRHSAVRQLERRRPEGGQGKNRPGFRPACGQWHLRSQPVAGTRRAEVPFARAHGSGEVHGSGSGEAGDEVVDTG